MSYEERKKLEFTKLINRQTIATHTYIIERQAAAIREICKAADIWHINGVPVEGYLKQNGYVPEKEEE